MQVWVRRKPSRLLGILCIQDDQPFTLCIPVAMSTSYTLSYASAYYSVYGGVSKLLLTENTGRRTNSRRAAARAAMQLRGHVKGVSRKRSGTHG